MPMFTVEMPHVLIDTTVEAEDVTEAIRLAIEVFQDWASDETNYTAEPVAL